MLGEAVGVGHGEERVKRRFAHVAVDDQHAIGRRAKRDRQIRRHRRSGVRVGTGDQDNFAP
jgi:hypothetical protein